MGIRRTALKGPCILARWLLSSLREPVQYHLLCKLSHTKTTLKELYMIISLKSNSFTYKIYYEEV